MIYVTGDTHRTKDIAKLRARSWPAGQTLTRDDLVVVCGDFGALWSERDLAGGGGALLRWWESQPWTTLFVDGNHENHDLIDALPTQKRFGAPAHVVPGCSHVVHLMRGYVYDLPLSGNKTARCLAMGGARSTDRAWRVEGESWWAREMPSDEEYDRCTASLEAADWKVDYVLTHELPANLRMGAREWTSYAEFAGDVDPLSNYLQWVYDTLDHDVLRMWYAGHYHVDRMVAKKCRVLYNDIVRLGAHE